MDLEKERKEILKKHKCIDCKNLLFSDWYCCGLDTDNADFDEDDPVIECKNYEKSTWDRFWK